MPFSETPHNELIHGIKVFLELLDLAKCPPTSSEVALLP